MLQQIIGGLDDLRSRAGVYLAVLSFCHFFHSLGLGQLRVDKRRMDMDECVSGVYGVTLFYKKFHYAAGELARYPHSCTFDLTFDDIVRLVHEYKTDNGDYGNYRHHDSHRQ